MSQKGINKAIIIGNLGADPDVRFTPSGSAVANLSIATNERWKDKQTGEVKEKTEWHRVVLFGKLGEIARDYLRKGSQIFVEGRIQTRKWQGQDGQDRYTTEIVARDMQMLGGASPGPRQEQQRSEAAPETAGEPAGESLQDDDIPF